MYPCTTYKYWRISCKVWLTNCFCERSTFVLRGLVSDWTPQPVGSLHIGTSTSLRRFPATKILRAVSHRCRLRSPNAVHPSTCAAVLCCSAVANNTVHFCTVQYSIPTAPTLHWSSCWCELSSVQLRQRKIPIAARCWCSQSRGGCANKSPLTPHSRPAACSAQATPHEWRSNCLYPLSRNRCGRSAERA